MAVRSRGHLVRCLGVLPLVNAVLASPRRSWHHLAVHTDANLTRGSQRMVKQAVATRTTELDPIDRLEEKVKLLVDVITQLRDEQARSADEKTRLVQEIASLRGRLVDAEATTGELTALRQEREVVRSRVAEMLQQLEAI